MATGVKPLDEDVQLSKHDLDIIGDALKDQGFRKLLADYCEEIQDPANKALYQKEMTQLEKERGMDIKFINPTKGYVIKTSVAGDRKAFINICSNENIGKPSSTIKEVECRKGLSWELPYSLVPPREDYDKKRIRCVVYDVVFHPDTLRMAENNKRFRDMVNDTAFNSLENTYKIQLDRKNCKFPRLNYKGIVSAAVIRKTDPDFKPDENIDVVDQEIIDKLYPQQSYSHEAEKQDKMPKTKVKSRNNSLNIKPQDMGSHYTTPRYSIKQQRNLDLQEFTFDKNAKQFTTIPDNLIIEVNLPLLTGVADCTLDVHKRDFSLVCEKPARYRLKLTLPYAVNDKFGNAKFDKRKHLLTVTLPVIKNECAIGKSDIHKHDSGVESEANSPCPSEEDVIVNPSLVTELESSNECDAIPATGTEPSVENDMKECFLDRNLSYLLPQYTHNILDNMIAFTLHVKNVDPDTVMCKNIDEATVALKFTSIGSGFVPVHYAIHVKFDNNVTCDNIMGEAWDNNVIMQVETSGNTPQYCYIGVSSEDLRLENFDVPIEGHPEVQEKPDNPINVSITEEKPSLPPVIEVSNTSLETSIKVTSNDSESELNSSSSEQNVRKVTMERDIIWVDTGSAGSTKGILRNSVRMARSLSESSVDGRDIASSMDYISSDCIPEESSLKKTVRFNHVIAEQVFRSNSSILGQKKKNQRKKMKKRNQHRRKSESEADDEQVSTDLVHKKHPGANNTKLSEKERRDSGLVETSDTDGDTRKGIRIPSEPISCDSIKHNTTLYDPDKLNKGLYLEVAFKNDLIFELDM